MLFQYLENVLSTRDLVAICAENAKDLNKLAKQFRDVMKLNVNLIQIDPTSSPEQFQPPSGKIVDPDFKGAYTYPERYLLKDQNVSFKFISKGPGQLLSVGYFLW